MLERVERILGSMNKWGKAARESAWRIAVEFWRQSRGFINVHTPKKCHPIFPPLFSLMNRSVYSRSMDCFSDLVQSHFKPIENVFIQLLRAVHFARQNCQNGAAFWVRRSRNRSKSIKMPIAL